jgi:hypothetical protein
MYSQFKNERLSTNIKVTLYKALVRSVMTYACPTWELVADTYLLKLQRLQDKVLRNIGKFPRRTPFCDLHTTFNLLYVYNYIIKFFREQAEVIPNHKNEHVPGVGQDEARQKI